MSGCYGRASALYGEGLSIGHAGELLQGVVQRGTALEPFLVTLPNPSFVSRAIIWPTECREDSVEPAWKLKALRAARRAWNTRADRTESFRLIIDSRMPVGRGCGSSTSDCVAAIRAVAHFLACSFSRQETACWVTQAETASDSTMFDLLPVAFRQRRGRVLQFLGAAFPALRVIVVDLGGPPVDTVSRSLPLYSPDEIDTFRRLLKLMKTRITNRDSRGVAQIATKSATIQQRYYPHPRWNDFQTACFDRRGTLGVACSHSGTLGIALLELSDRLLEDRLVADFRAMDLSILSRYICGNTFPGEESSCPSS